MTEEDFATIRARRQERVERARGPFDTLCSLKMLSVNLGGGLDGARRLPVGRRLERELSALGQWCYDNRMTPLARERAVLSTWIVVDQLVAEFTAAAGPQQDPTTIVWAEARMRAAMPRACARFDQALAALHEWREANQQQLRPAEEVCLVIRAVAEACAGEIAAHAGSGQDPATVAWIVAGLRCRDRPFCLGCHVCFTIDAPHRADVDFAKAGGSRG